MPDLTREVTVACYKVSTVIDTKPTVVPSSRNLSFDVLRINSEIEAISYFLSRFRLLRLLRSFDKLRIRAHRND
ncbi:MAG TPA: hypothetical protein VGA95_01815 [Thermodesulfobacteriota bacterium]